MSSSLTDKGYIWVKSDSSAKVAWCEVKADSYMDRRGVKGNIKMSMIASREFTSDTAAWLSDGSKRLWIYIKGVIV